MKTARHSSLAAARLLAALGVLFAALVPVRPQDGRAPTLRELAAADPQGHHVQELLIEGRYDDIHEITQDADEIVSGTAVGPGACRLTEDGRGITTEFEIRIDAVFKGKLKSGQRIVVALPGGFVDFGQGLSAELRSSWIRSMTEGQGYVLFLARNPRDGGFCPVGGGQGIFGFGEEGLLSVHTGRAGDPFWNYQGMDRESFLDLIRWAVRDDEALRRP